MSGNYLARVYWICWLLSLFCIVRYSMHCSCGTAAQRHRMILGAKMYRKKKEPQVPHLAQKPAFGSLDFLIETKINSWSFRRPRPSGSRSNTVVPAQHSPLVRLMDTKSTGGWCSSTVDTMNCWCYVHITQYYHQIRWIFIESIAVMYLYLMCLPHLPLCRHD